MSAHLRMLLGLGLLGSTLTIQTTFAQDLPILPPLEDEPPQNEPIDPAPFDNSPPPRRAAPEQPAPAPRRALPPPPQEPELMFEGGGIAIQGGIGGSSQILLGFNAGPALFGLGLGLGYDPMGAPVSTGRSNETVSFNLATSFSYMAYNTKPVAFGPEVDFEATLAPGPAFSSSALRFGFAMWYAPFHAPVYIGTMIGLRVGFVKGGDPSVSTEYPGLRLRWGF